MRQPARAAHRMAAWRAQTLTTLCSDALVSIGEVLRSDRQGPRPLGQAWYYRLLAEGGNVPRLRK